MPAPRRDCLDSKNGSAVYYALAAFALFGTWSFNIRFILEGKSIAQFPVDGFAGNALASLSIDIYLIALILILWMMREGRRYSIAHTWIYVVLSLCVAVSVMFPLFLVARYRALTRQTEIHRSDALTLLYPIGSGIALVSGNLFLIRYLLEGNSIVNFIPAWFTNNAGGSLAMDLIFLTITLIVFGVQETRRGTIRRLKIYVLMCLFGVAVGMPWMLRELDVQQKRQDHETR